MNTRTATRDDAMTIGVVVPVRNGEPSLAAALDSILDQRTPASQIIVVDGGSTDRSAEIARSRPGVEVIRQTGSGLASARNEGVDRLTTDIVTFLDADDTWPRDSLESRLAALVDLGADAVVGAVRTVAVEGMPVPGHRQVGLGTDASGWTPSAVMVRRHVFGALVGPFDETLRVGCDSDWLVRLRESSAAVHELERCVLLKGVRDDSLSVDVDTYGDELLRIAWQFVRRRRATNQPTAPQPDRRRPRATTEILHVLPRFIGGGPERSVMVIAAEGRAAGLEVGHTVMVLEPPISPGMHRRARHLDVDVVERPGPERLSAELAAADAIVVHYWNNPVLIEFLEGVELPERPVVLWARILGTEPPQIVTDDLVGLADAVFLTSPVSAASEGAIAARSAGVPIEIVAGALDRTRLAATRRRPPSPGELVVGYVGSLQTTKMHPRLPEMCAEVADPRVKFVFVGDGDGDLLRRRLGSLGLADRAVVRPHTEDIGTVFGELDVFGFALAPTSYATTDRTLQEAMWCGLPPVVLSGGGVGAMVADGQTGLVVGERDWADAIERLADDPGLVRRLGDNARSHARRAFDPAAATARTIDLLTAMTRRSDHARRSLPTSVTGAERFTRSLGRHGRSLPQFADRLARRIEDPSLALTPAEQALADSPDTFAYGEGGIVHYRNRYPADPLLRYWSALVAEGRGQHETAAAELAAAAELWSEEASVGE